MSTIEDNISRISKEQWTDGYQQGREDATKEMDLTSAYAKGRADERAKLLSVSQEQLTNALEILLSNEDGTDCIKDVISLLELVKTLQ